MNSATKSIVIEADAKTVYEYVAKPESLPLWAIHFCQGIRKERR